MKLSTCLIIFLLLLNAQGTKAQCNYSDTASIKIGQVITDTSFCPSSGKITLNNITGGGGQYVYEITSGPVIRIIQSQNVFNALASGSYLVRITGCNGKVKDTLVKIINGYTDMSVYYWQQMLVKQSGLECGITNNAVYKITRPTSPWAGGSAPFRIQFSTSANFTSIPYEAGNDSAVFSGLTQSSTYYVRITDACNNFQTFNFTTPAATAAVAVSVPSLSFQRAYLIGSCSSNEIIFINFLDSATGAGYDPANTYNSKVIWDKRYLPVMRIKIENRNNGAVYTDRHISVSKSGTNYNFGNYYQQPGEPAFATPDIGFNYANYNPNNYQNVLPTLYTTSEFPPNAPLRITLFFPGGDHCGNIVEPYSKAFNFDLGTYGQAQTVITGIQNNCSAGTGSYFKVDFSSNWVAGNITLVDPTPVYTVLSTKQISTYSQFYTSVSSNSLTIGHTYRIILQDSCGRKDSADVVYNPGYTPVLAPVFSDTIKSQFNCPANPYDTVYTILYRPLPTGYSVTGGSIDGIGTVYFYAVPNWNGGTQTGYRVNKILPPGTYTINIDWLYQCQQGRVTQTVTISPNTDAAVFSRNVTLSIQNSVQNCSTNGYTAIAIEGYLKNVNTNYRFNNLRLISAPSALVFPLTQKTGGIIYRNGETITYYTSLVNDTTKLYNNYAGIIINNGQEGTYTIAIDIVCPDGSLIESITKSIEVHAVTAYNPSTPTLKYANALICGGNGGTATINMLPLGGTRPFTYQYKLESDINYISTNNAGADSAVVITTTPAPGTIYDIRVVDACGKSATSKVSFASFTGEFFLYQFPPDCNKPFDAMLGTSAVGGAYYTWKRNGNIIAEGFNKTTINIPGISYDTITLSVNMADCYNREISRILVFKNPCNFIVLPVKTLLFTGTRTSVDMVKLNWETGYEPSVKYFEIEKSTNGSDFKYIGRTNAGKTDGQNRYLLSDSATNQQIYYRLKIVDNNGQYTYSNVVAIKNAAIAMASIKTYPNPAHNDLILLVTSDKTATLKVTIYNNVGQPVIQTSINKEEMNTGKKINIAQLSAGTYFIRMYNDSNVNLTEKFVKQ